MNKQKRTISPFVLVFAVIIMLFVFFLLFSSRASAGEGDLNQIQRYESVLIKDGDTLSSLSHTYADQYSHYTNETYLEAVMQLNDLSSEHIHSGDYLLMPVYHE